MRKDNQIQSLNKEYGDRGLSLKIIEEDPFVQFHIWFSDMLGLKQKGINAFVLSTIDKEGCPSSRTVLLKTYDQKGFVFYTNYKSQKMKHISLNPSVSLLFHWKEYGRDIRILGKANRVDRDMTEKYFQSRPRKSQISAWASQQSEKVSCRSELEQHYREYRQKYFLQKIPCPLHWGGVCVVPTQFEFWQGRSSRLHDRIVYDWDDGYWTKKRLMP